MALKLSERLQKRAIEKEQRRAEKLAIRTDMSGQEIVAKLASDAKRINLIQIEKAAAEFERGTNSDVFNRLMESKKHRVLYEIAKEWLQGDWLGQFRKLIAVIPGVQRNNVARLSWSDWKAYGEQVGFDEDATLGVLRMILVFKPA